MRYDFGDFVERSSIREDYVEYENIHGVGIEAKSVEQECPLDFVIGGLSNIFSINRKTDPSNLFVPSKPKFPKTFLGFPFHLS